MKKFVTGYRSYIFVNLIEVQIFILIQLYEKYYKLRVQVKLKRQGRIFDSIYFNLNAKY